MIPLRVVKEFKIIMKTCYFCYKSLEEKPFVHGMHEACFQQCFELKDSQSRFCDLYIKHQNDSSIQPNNTSFFHGKFEKYSATLEGKSYILKLSKDYPELPLIEFICNQIGEALGFDIPAYYLCDLTLNRPCFVTYNFMQDYPGGNLEHIYHYLSEKDWFSVETLLSIIEKETGRLTEIRKFIHLCLFDAFIGNHDRHGRNIGFIVTPSGLKLSPLYDNPSFFGITEFLEAENNPRGRIRTQAEENPSLRDYIYEFKRLGYYEELIPFFKKINLLKIKKLVDMPLLSNSRKKAFMQFLDKQYQEVLNALEK